MKIQHFFEPMSSTLTYVVHDGRHGVVIDPVRDYDPRSGRTGWDNARAVASLIDEIGLRICYVIDTHAHADHLSGLPFFKERYGARTVTGSRVGEVQKVFHGIFNFDEDVAVDGSQFDVLLDEGDSLEVGSLKVNAMHTPGHTPAHMAWQVNDAVFVGDTVFAPDYGTARCDFPGGSAAELYYSIQRIYAMPGETRLFLCHDYQPGGRDIVFETTVAEQKRCNVQLNAVTTKEAFIAFREKRDAALAIPNLLLPSIQVNVRAGELPEPEANGTAYLKIPLNRF